MSIKEGDHCVWGRENHGLFSAKSAYGGLVNLNSGNGWKGKCTWVWKLRVLEQVCFFIGFCFLII